MRATSLFALALCVSLAACGHSSNVKTESARTSQQAAAPGATVVAAAGTRFYGKLSAAINSKSSHDGDTFQLQQTDTMLHKNAALHGTVIEGHLENVHAAGVMRKPSMTLVFDDIVLAGGTKSPVDVQLVSMNAFEAKSHKLRTLGMMVGGAVAGHEMKKHTGKGGGLLGAAGGYALSQSMKTDISVPAGTVLELKFKAPVTTNSP